MRGDVMLVPFPFARYGPLTSSSEAAPATPRSRLRGRLGITERPQASTMARRVRVFPAVQHRSRRSLSCVLRERTGTTASGHQRLAVPASSEKTDLMRAASRSCSKPLYQSGCVDPDLEHGAAGERQPVPAGRQADHAVPAGEPPASDDDPRRHLVLVLERPHLAAVLFQDRLPVRRSASGNPGGMETRENRATPRTRPRRPPRGPAGPDAAALSPRRRAARHSGPCACG